MDLWVAHRRQTDLAAVEAGHRTDSVVPKSSHLAVPAVVPQAHCLQSDHQTDLRCCGTGRLDAEPSAFGLDNPACRGVRSAVERMDCAQLVHKRAHGMAWFAADLLVGMAVQPNSDERQVALFVHCAFVAIFVRSTVDTRLVDTRSVGLGSFDKPPVDTCFVDKAAVDKRLAAVTHLSRLDIGRHVPAGFVASLDFGCLPS